MIVDPKMYVIRGPEGWFYGVALCRRNFKPDVDWVDAPKDAFKMTLQQAISIQSCLAAFQRKPDVLRIIPIESAAVPSEEVAE